MTYKSLRNTSGEWVTVFAEFGPCEILTTGIPELFSEETTIELLGEYYSDVDFTGIELVTVEITIKP